MDDDFKPKFYLEAHITISPLTEEQKENISSVMSMLGFKLAQFLMKPQDKTGAFIPAEDPNAFLSCREYESFGTLKIRMHTMIKVLKAENIEIRRYKVEDTVADTRHEIDPLEFFS